MLAAKYKMGSQTQANSCKSLLIRKSGFNFVEMGDVLSFLPPKSDYLGSSEGVLARNKMIE